MRNIAYRKITFIAIVVIAFTSCADNKNNSVNNNDSSHEEKKLASIGDTFFNCEVHSKNEVLPKRSKLFADNPFLFLRIHPYVQRISVNLPPDLREGSTKSLEYKEFGSFLINATDELVGINIKYEDHYQFNLYSGILTVDEYFYDISIENESKLTNHLRTYYECSKVNKLVDINR